ncbi:uncharacterized protein LOC142948447 [Anarhichas minor]|uniref:uncharacterized protein LOC142948447 n=1 Tax=Anarhichas minor TaxID=65739 RepID=UPI003F7376B5
MTWTETQSYCREHHTDLASVSNIAENQTVRSLVSEIGVWIGLFRDGWKWSDGGDSLFRNWKPHDSQGSLTVLKHQTAAGLHELHVYSHRLTERIREETRMDKLLLSIVIVSGLCAVSSPAERRYHFVYDLKNMTEAQRHCRETYSDLATIRDMEDVNTLNTMVHSSQMVDNSSVRLRETFVLINNTMTWTEAQSYCREHHTDLASVRNMEEIQKVQNLVPYGDVWIGLSRDGWKWSDGSGLMEVTPHLETGKLHLLVSLRLVQQQILVPMDDGRT